MGSDIYLVVLVDRATLVIDRGTSLEVMWGGNTLVEMGGDF